MWISGGASQGQGGWVKIRLVGETVRKQVLLQPHQAGGTVWKQLLLQPCDLCYIQA